MACVVYGRFDSKIRFENESDGRFDSRFDSNEKTIRRSLIFMFYCIDSVLVADVESAPRIDMTQYYSPQQRQ